jgi:hypothetical protein
VDKGADIISFIYKPIDIEIMMKMPAGIRESAKFIPTSSSMTGAFFDYYPGGWQEALPGGNPKTIDGAESGLHGEACCLPWSFKVLEDHSERVSVELSCELIRFPFYISKTLTLKRGEAKLHIHEKIENKCIERKDLIWAQHIAFGEPFITPDCTIDLDANEFRTTTYFNSPTAIFPADHRAAWPISRAENGVEVDLSKVSPLNAPHADMYYIKGLQKGEYNVFNPALGVGVKLRWDPKIFPYITYINVTGGLKGYPFYGRVYYIGLELWNSFSDVYSEAKENGSLRQMQPYEIIDTKLCVEII